MADIESQVKITAVDGFSSTLNNLGGTLSTLGSKFGALGAAIGVAFSAGAAISWLTNITRQSIDAAGRIDDLSQSLGVSGETLSRFSLAAKLNGTDLESLAGGMQKLNVKIDAAADGSKEATAAFARVGISVRNASGEVKTSDEVMAELADRFADMEDGAGKTAIAVELLGKSGAELIPFLNAGRDGLEEATAAADALGITMSGDTIAAAALAGDQLDTVAQVAVGLGNKIMAEVLPTVIALTRGFVDFIVETGLLDIAAQGVAIAFKSLYASGQIVYGVFKTVTTVVGAAAEALLLFVQGEYSQAWGALKRGYNDTATVITNTADNVRLQWTTTAADVAKANDTKATPSIKRLADATKAGKAETDKAAEAYTKFAEKLADKVRESEAEYNAERKLTEAEKLRGQFMAELERGVIKATEAERRSVAAQLDKLAGLERSIDLEKRNAEWIKESGKANDERAESVVKSTAEVWKLVKAAEEEGEAIGKSSLELAQLEIGRVADTRAMVAQRLERLLAITGTTDETDALREQIAAYDVLINRKRANAVGAALAEEAQAAKERWKEASTAIESSLTDALMRAFEDGADFGRGFVDTVKNLFKTLVLRPTIQAIVQPVAGGITALLGLTGTATAGTGYSGAAGALGTAGSLASGAGGLGGLVGGFGGALGAFGSSMGASLATTFSGPGLFATLGEAATLVEGGAVASGLGMGAGALLPYLGAALAIASIFGKKRGGPKTGGSFSTTGERLFTPGNADTEAATLGRQALDSIRTIAAEFGGSAGDLAVGFGFDTDPQGTAGSRIASFLRAGGRSVLDNTAGRDVGRDDAALQAGLGDEVARLVLAGLKESQLPARIREYLATADATAITAADLDAILARARAIASETVLFDSSITPDGVGPQRPVTAAPIADTVAGDKIAEATERTAQATETVSATYTESAGILREIRDDARTIADRQSRWQTAMIEEFRALREAWARIDVIATMSSARPAT